MNKVVNISWKLIIKQCLYFDEEAHVFEVIKLTNDVICPPVLHYVNISSPFGLVQCHLDSEHCHAQLPLCLNVLGVSQI